MPELLQLAAREIFIPHRPLLVGEGNERRIKATINTRDVDAHGTILDPAGMIPIARPLSLLAYHDNERPVGRIEFVDRRADSIVIEAVIGDLEIFELVRSGALSGVSVGFRVLEADWKADPPRITKWELVEVSIVPVPSNPGARIEEIRSMQTSSGGAVVPYTPRVVREFSASAPAIHHRGNPRFHLSSVLAAFIRDEPLRGFEAEAMRELANISDIPSRQGMRVPAALFQQRSLHYGARAVSTDPGSAQALSPEAWMQSLLDDASAARRWSTLSNRLGFNVISSLEETIHIPKRLTRVKAGFIPKDTEAPVSPDPTWGENVLGPTYVAVTTPPIQRSALRYSNPAVDQIIVRDVSEALEDEIDNAVLWGDGTGILPLGLLTRPAIDVNRAGTPVTWPDLRQLKSFMIESWRLDDVGNSLRWTLHPTMVDLMRTTSVKDAPPAVVGEWNQGIIPLNVSESSILAIPMVQSGRHTPRDLAGVKVNDIHLIMGAMGIICYFGASGVDLIVNPFKYSTSGALEISAFVDLNCVSRDVNLTARIYDAAM